MHSAKLIYSRYGPCYSYVFGGTTSDFDCIKADEPIRKGNE